MNLGQAYLGWQQQSENRKLYMELIKQCQRFDRYKWCYKWYKRDLCRKRPNRKKGRDLYHGILAYRRRVGQREDRLSFRGVARMYDILRIKVIKKNPELAAKIPDLYMRFINLRFPPHEIEAQMYAKPRIAETINKSIMMQFYHDLGAMRIMVPPLIKATTARMLDGKDAILARGKEVNSSDVVTSFAMAVLEDEEKNKKNKTNEQRDKNHAEACADMEGD